MSSVQHFEFPRDRSSQCVEILKEILGESNTEDTYNKLQ